MSYEGIKVSASRTPTIAGTITSVTTLTALTGNHTMVAGEATILKLTAAATANIVLPTTPPVATRVLIKDGGANFVVFPVTVVPGGTDKVENDTSMVISNNRAAVELMYDGAGGWWAV